MLALAVGVLWLLEVTIIHLNGETVLSMLLMLLGLGLVATARRGGRLWPLVLGVALTIALVAGSTSFHLGIPSNGGFGRHLFNPASATELQSTYELTAGEQTFDLSRLTAANEGSGRTVLIRQGFGKVTILVPPTLPVTVHARVTFGSFVSPDGPQRGGVGLNEEYATPAAGPGALQIDIKEFAGAITVATPGPTAPPPSPTPKPPENQPPDPSSR
jgi:hypothetical protein